MASLYYLLCLLALLFVPFALSRSLRRRAFDHCLFPLGYFLYTSKFPGLTLHEARYMSSAKAPAVPHTKVDAVSKYGEGEAAVTVVPIPLLEDNYAFLILHPASLTAAVVDPADPHPVCETLRQQYPEYRLTHILTTHHHWDHAGGNLAMAKLFPGIAIVGGKGDNVAAATRECTTGDIVDLAPGEQGQFRAHIYQCPCHTKGHILFGVGPALFTGDTLFAGGCGRFFEGNAAQMYENLYTTLGRLPDDTAIFPGHEYTVANLEFGLWVEPDSVEIRDKLIWSQERRAGKFPTIPTTLGEEKKINPFMRVHEEAVAQRVARVVNLATTTAADATADGKVEQGVRVMDALRTLKNQNAHKKK